MWKLGSPKFSIFWNGQSATAKSYRSSSVNMSMLNGYIRLTKNQVLMLFGVSAFGSDCFTIDFFFLIAPTRGSLLPLLERRAEFSQFLDQGQSVGLLGRVTLLMGCRKLSYFSGWILNHASDALDLSKGFSLWAVCVGKESNTAPFSLARSRILKRKMWLMTVR
jgi:hypothetical protein